MARILVVENSPLMRPALCDLLAMDGHTVVPAVHILEARCKLEKTAFDVLVINVMPPDMSGLNLVQKLRAEATYDSLSILAYTATEDLRMCQRAINAGADRFLERPLTVAKFKSAVRRLLPESTLPQTPPVLQPAYAVSFMTWWEQKR